MNHEQVRVILNSEAGEIPEEVAHEDKLVRWADALYLNAMRIAAAGVLEDRGSLEKAASVVWWAGFAAPPGHFSEDKEDELSPLDGEEALRAWVEAEASNIEEALSGIGFYMAGHGKMADPIERRLPGDEYESLRVAGREDSDG